MTTPNPATRGTRVERKCETCKRIIHPRIADVKRGWGKFCSKSCKAVKQEQRTGQYASFRSGSQSVRVEEEDEFGWDAHK